MFRSKASMSALVYRLLPSLKNVASHFLLAFSSVFIFSMSSSAVTSRECSAISSIIGDMMS